MALGCPWPWKSNLLTMSAPATILAYFLDHSDDRLTRMSFLFISDRQYTLRSYLWNFCWLHRKIVGILIWEEGLEEMAASLSYQPSFLTHRFELSDVIASFWRSSEGVRVSPLRTRFSNTLLVLPVGWRFYPLRFSCLRSNFFQLFEW